MTKEKFIDTVLIRVGGGTINDESAVWKQDIRAYMSAAINYTVAAGYNVNIKNEGNRDLSAVFYGYFPGLTLSKDSTKNNRRYITLPKGTIALPRNQGIRFVTDNCENTYKPLSDASMGSIKHYEKQFPGVSFFRLEKRKIYLYNIGPLVESLNLTMIVSVDDLDPTDELPIPAGMEPDAIDIAVQFFTGERQLPSDEKNDKTDIN